MIKNIAISAGISLLVSICVVSINSQFIQDKKTFASVDLRKIMANRLESYKKQMDNGETVPPDEAVKFADALESTIKLLESDESTIILNSPAVISGVRDYTPVVMEMITAEMNSNEHTKS